MVCVDDARIVRRTYACNCFKIVPKPHQLVHVVLARFPCQCGRSPSSGDRSGYRISQGEQGEDSVVRTIPTGIIAAFSSVISARPERAERGLSPTVVFAAL